MSKRDSSKNRGGTMSMDLSGPFSVPFIDFRPDDKGYIDAYEKGAELDAVFPDQDATDLMYACEFNDWGPLQENDQHGSAAIEGLLLVKPGERDSENWIWLVKLDDGTHWWAQGGCDYTGWDCQSNLEWEQYV